MNETLDINSLIQEVLDVEMGEIAKKIDEEIRNRNEIIKSSHGMELDTRAVISGLQIAKQIILPEQKESCECEILHSQLMETEKSLLDIREERDYWEREAKKWCSQLSELRYKIKQQICDECKYEDTDKCLECDK